MLEQVLIRLLLRGRKEYSGMVKIRKKMYRVTVTEFVPADQWVEKLEKAMKEVEK